MQVLLRMYGIFYSAVTFAAETDTAADMTTVSTIHSVAVIQKAIAII